MSLTDKQIKTLAKRMDIPFGGVFFKDESLNQNLTKHIL